jgi:hypothetical protein
MSPFSSPEEYPRPRSEVVEAPAEVPHLLLTVSTSCAIMDSWAARRRHHVASSTQKPPCVAPGAFFPGVFDG